jgi:hypothetical protein
LAGLVDAGCTGVLFAFAAVAEDPMRDGLKAFLLRLLFLYPLCLAGWWALVSVQIETISALASSLLSLLTPNVKVVLQRQ